jgi:hypothetical protein
MYLASLLTVCSNRPLKNTTSALPVANGWANYLATTEKDDMEVHAKNQGKRKQQGDEFRPEIREVYKDLTGRKEVKMYEKVGGV